MAQMHPSREYTEFHSSQEENIFDVFERSLSDDYQVFHSEDWFKSPNQPYEDQHRGEIDFVVAHPEKGLLSLEAKGGGIGYDPSEDSWYSIGKNSRHELKRNPLHQAEAGMNQLKERMEETNKIGSPGRFPGLLGCGVIFSDMSRQQAHEIPPVKLPSELIVFGDEFEDIGSSLNQLYEYWSEEFPNRELKQNEWQVLKDNILRGEFEVGVSMISELRRDKKSIIKLKEDQIKKLRFMGDRDRAYIKGCAGTGKTVLALEKAKRLSAEGKKTLWLCYNKHLHEEVERKHGDEIFDINHFHKFAIDVLKETGVDYEVPDGKFSRQSFWNEDLPEKLMDAAEFIDEKFDALIIDEAQDFKDLWFWAMEEVLREDGQLYAFYDPYQSIYDEVPDWLRNPEREPFNLEENCRNTKQIGEAFLKIGNVGEQLEFGPTGVPVQVRVTDSEEDIPDQLRKAFHETFNEQDMSPINSVVLSRFKKENSLLNDVSSLGNYKLREEVSPNGETVHYSTIKSYKGLEAEVVFLINPKLDDSYQKEYYTGASRAKLLLWIITTDQKYKEILNSD